MEFLQPALLWGFLAVTIPVVIHFWYQKKGKTIAWAASQWLIDKTSLQNRGLRLDEIPLLLIRCLLVILLVLLLSKPIVNWFRSSPLTEKIHLVEPDNLLVSNFRFELENAIKKGEKIYWIGAEKQEAKDISVVPKQKDVELYLQKSISRVSETGKELNLYISYNQKLAGLPKIYVPGSFKLFSIIDSTLKAAISYLDLGNGKKLFADRNPNGVVQLKVTGVTDNIPASQFASEPVHKGKIQVLIDYKNPAEQQTVQAAMLALGEVYSIPFVIDLAKKTDIKYEWIFTDQKMMETNPGTLYFIRNDNARQNLSENIIPIQDSLRLSTSELVQNGAVPEWVGNILVAHYKLNEDIIPLSQQQLNARFISVKPVANQNANKIYQWLLLFFVITLIVERWIALRKNTSQTYA
ncbi:BatA domain-containing protein [Dyadobacter sp. NIV53]|uniref:BatA domain-containing protein n=1 Tax=Dyadobacter sp. NIV53 TaxID=2861765 RepID=UPI001C886A05|nr:BatA domain-containing protein [Dyadobacter sp. NIV53]